MKAVNVSRTILLLSLACALPAIAQPYAYVPNYNAGTVSVIDTATNSVVASVPVGTNPGGVAVNGSGSRIYVANRGSNNVSVLDGSNSVIATIPVGVFPTGVTVSPDGLTAYVTNFSNDSVSVINTGSNAVSATIAVGARPQGVAVDPSGSRLYVANTNADSISVVDTATNTVLTSVNVGDGPLGIALDASGESLYVANSLDGTVSVVSTASLTVTGTVSVGASPQMVTANPNGNFVYVANFGSSTISEISTATDTVTATVAVSGGVRGVSASQTGAFLYASTQSNTRVAVVNALTKAIVLSIPVALPRPLGDSLAHPGYGVGGIGSGHYHQCRVRQDNSVHCWGRDDFGQSTPPAGSFTGVVAGSSHTCGLMTDGSVACWGNDAFGQATPPSGAFTQITAGFRHTCGRRENGTVECWGDDTQGQATAPAGNFALVRGGSSHTCAIDAVTGAAVCWGRNVDGQSTPVPGNYQNLALGASVSCGLLVNGQVACWGLNDQGQASPPSSQFASISSEAFYSCGLHFDGSVECWGTNAQGQQTVPTGSFLQLGTARTSVCGLRPTGQVSCWGDNDYTQAPRFAITPALLPAGEVAQPYNATVLFTEINPSGVRPPYALDTPVLAVDGSLPPGLTMDNAGNISGTPTTDGVYNFSIVGEDANGLYAETAYSINVSLSAPIITPNLTGMAGANGWFVGNVGLTWTVTDPESPVTSTTGCGPSSVTVSTSASGVDFTCSASSAGGTNSVTVTIKLDKIRPTLAPTISANRPLINDATVVATPNGGDANSGVDTASCAAANTSSIGSKLLTCTATDVAGNTYQRTVAYRVIYGFVGFNGGVVNPGQWNSAISGNQVSADYRLVDVNGNGVTGAAAPSLVHVASGCPANIANVTTPSADPSGVQDLGNGFYRMVWTAGAPQCSVVNFDFGDGQTTQHRLLFRYL